MLMSTTRLEVGQPKLSRRTAYGNLGTPSCPRLQNRGCAFIGWGVPLIGGKSREDHPEIDSRRHIKVISVLGSGGAPEWNSELVQQP